MKFEELVGKTLKEVIGKVEDEQIIFITSEDKSYKLYHEGDCCERVQVVDIIGDFKDIVGSPILLAEEVTSDKDPEDYENKDGYRESFTWTFYKLSTIKGSVTIRWLGESNGFYSESVDFCEV